MKPKCISAAALAVLLLTASLASCGDSENQPINSTQSAVTGDITAEATTDDGRLPSALPADLDFGGEVLNIWHFTTWDDPTAERGISISGNPEGDVVDAAIYDRNVTVEEQLHVDLNFVDTGANSGGVGDAVRKVIMAGDATYDLYNMIQWNSTALALEHCFMSITDAPYLQLDQPWWSQNYMEALSLGQDNMYFLAGDVTLDMIRCISSMYYNKNLYANLYDDADGLYNEVLDGSWTMERLSAYIQEAYSDINGNGSADDGDIWGIITNDYNNIDAFTFGMGAILTERDENNYPYLVIERTHNVDLYAKVWDLTMNTPGVKLDHETKLNIPKFAEGQSLFLPGFLYTSELLRDMQDDYGIIPFPKYDETQEDYVSCVHDIATLMALPTTCQKVDMTCAVLEAMAYHSYYDVTPVYYETALKTKYSRDNISSQIIDILHDAGMTDFGYVYAGSLNGAGMIMRNMILTKNQNFASSYEKQQKAANKAMEKLIENFETSID